MGLGNSCLGYVLLQFPALVTLTAFAQAGVWVLLLLGVCFCSGTDSLGCGVGAGGGWSPAVREQCGCALLKEQLCSLGPGLPAEPVSSWKYTLALWGLLYSSAQSWLGSRLLLSCSSGKLSLRGSFFAKPTLCCLSFRFVPWAFDWSPEQRAGPGVWLRERSCLRKEIPVCSCHCLQPFLSVCVCVKHRRGYLTSGTVGRWMPCPGM